MDQELARIILTAIERGDNPFWVSPPGVGHDGRKSKVSKDRSSDKDPVHDFETKMAIRRAHNLKLHLNLLESLGYIEMLYRRGGSYAVNGLTERGRAYLRRLQSERSIE